MELWLGGDSKRGKGLTDSPYSELRRLLNENKGTGKLFDYTSRHGLKFWTRIKAKMNHPYTLHDLRKTFAVKLVNSGVSIYDAKSLLRHSTVKVTERYYVKASLDRLGSEAERVFKPTELKIVKFQNA